MNCHCSSLLPSTTATHRSLFSRFSSPPRRQHLKIPSSSSTTFARSKQQSSTLDASVRLPCVKDLAELNSKARVFVIQDPNGVNVNARYRHARTRLRSAASMARASRSSTTAAAGPQDGENGTAVEKPAGDSSEIGESAAAAPLPTMEDIVAAAAQDGVQLTVHSFGPTFEIVVSSPDGSRIFGKAQGFVRVWTQGKILHLESVNLERGLSKSVGNIFGAGFFVGAATLRYGLDCGCRIAQLMAIYDDEVTHSKLVKYYSRLGFKAVYEVGEEDLKHIPDRVMWGGTGTRMDADCEELVRRWSAALRPKPRTSASA